MAKLTWDDVGKRIYEIGLDRGVLYLESNVGIAWNGLRAIEEDLTETNTDAVYFDGSKHIDSQNTGDFSATIKALTYPDAFLEYEGVSELETGVVVANQNSKMFGLSYRTLVGNDVDNDSLGYKIHILYNLTAVPDNKTYSSIDDAASPIEFSWNVTSMPSAASGYRATAHVIVDSRYISLPTLSYIERALYGTSFASPILPDLDALLYKVINGVLYDIVITDNGNGTWTGEGPDANIVMDSPTTFHIDDGDTTIIDANTYTITSSFL